MAVNEFTKFIVTGVIGAIIGAGGAFYSFKSAATAENQFFMQMDFRRYQAATDTNMSLEERHALLVELKEAYLTGYESVFRVNLEQDIADAKASIVRIANEKNISNEAALKARIEEQKRTQEQSKAKAQAAVRRNPIIFEACMQPNSRILCP